LYVLETKKSCLHVPLVHGTEKHWKGQEKRGKRAMLSKVAGTQKEETRFIA
jgi:hypothetical protein